MLREKLKDWIPGVWEERGGKYWMKNLDGNIVYFGKRDHWKVYYPENTNRRRLIREIFVLSNDNVHEVPSNTKIVNIKLMDEYEKVKLLEFGQNPRGEENMEEVDTSFKAMLGKQQNKMHWIWNVIHSAKELIRIIQALRAGNLLAVSDGSYLDGIDMSVSILDDGSGERMWCLSVTPGAMQFQHSHRSKLAGVAASLVMVKTLWTFFRVDMEKVMVCLDGKQAIDNVLRERLVLEQLDYDMISQIQWLIESIPVYIEFKWVRGHQDDWIPFHQLSYPAQLNVIADHKAKEHLKRHIPSTIPDKAMIFPNEGWSMIFKGVKLSKVDPEIIYNQLMSHSLRNYWTREGALVMIAQRKLTGLTTEKLFVIANSPRNEE